MSDDHGATLSTAAPHPERGSLIPVSIVHFLVRGW